MTSTARTAWPTWSTGTQSSKITATTSGTTLTATATWLTTSVSRTAQTAQIREQQQLDFEEINLFSALFIVACLSSEPFHISTPSANSLPCGPSTGGSRVQTFWKLRYTV